MAQNILLVEDYPVIQDLYADALKSKGFNVDIAGDGDEALGMIENKDYHFILLDLLLPNTSGIEFLEKLESGKDTNIIVLSDFAYQKTVEKAFDLGVSNYWLKSENTPSQLADKLMDYQGADDSRPESTDTGLV